MTVERNIWFVWALLLSCTTGLYAQHLAVKSDLLTGALTSPNVGVEVKLSERYTLEGSFHYNPFPAGGDKRWKHWFIQPSLRYWLCQPFGGHFLGVNLTYGVYNAGGMKLPFGLSKPLHTSRYEGEFMGAGISYGYHFILSPRWGIELEAGAGFMHARYDRYRCFHCGEKTKEGKRDFLTPTKAAVSVVYMIW